jgi:hypothetical protein
VNESMTKRRSPIVRESTTSQTSNIYNLCKLYEKLSMLEPRSSSRTQLRLYSSLFLIFRDRNVPLSFIPSPVLLLGRYRPDICRYDSKKK